jgi:hypothetical protein
MIRGKKVDRIFAAWGIRTPAGKPTAFRVRRLNHSAKAADLNTRSNSVSVVVYNAVKTLIHCNEPFPLSTSAVTSFMHMILFARESYVSTICVDMTIYGLGGDTRPSSLTT